MAKCILTYSTPMHGLDGAGIVIIIIHYFAYSILVGNYSPVALTIIVKSYFLLVKACFRSIRSDLVSSIVIRFIPSRASTPPHDLPLIAKPSVLRFAKSTPHLPCTSGSFAISTRRTFILDSWTLGWRFWRLGRLHLHTWRWSVSLRWAVSIVIVHRRIIGYEKPVWRWMKAARLWNVFSWFLTS